MGAEASAQQAAPGVVGGTGKHEPELELRAFRGSYTGSSAGYSEGVGTSAELKFCTLGLGANLG